MIGTGYVGLVSGACFSDFGHEVTCIDKDKSKIEMLEQGKIPIFEPGLDKLVDENVKAGRLAFTTNFADAVPDANAVFITVGTPSHQGDGYADLSFVYAAAAEIADTLNDFTVIVIKSTVPVGTGRKVERIIQERNPSADFSVASNPEFLREGVAIEDFKHPDRIVVGTDNERPKQVMRELYRSLYLGETPVLFTGRETSELIKYAGNAFLATKIAFINEISDLCEQVGANIQDVSKGIGLDGRIGKKFLHAGPGFGGSCFPKDALALIRTASEHGTTTRIIEAVVDVNQDRKKRMGQKIIDACGGTVAGKTIAILGLTFKPNTDDMRNSPSLDIIPFLQEAGAKIRAFDPEGMEESKKLLERIEYSSNAYEAMEGADAVTILTEWNEFQALDKERIKEKLNTALLIDLRNIYTLEEMASTDIEYHSVGRRPIKSGT
jgi:UDPglucose 6-dehydrogenase